MKLRLPKFETVPDNDKPIDWQYVKKTYKDYITGDSMTLKERINNTLLQKSHYTMMYLIATILYGMYLYNVDLALWISALIPNAYMILGTLGFVAILALTVDSFEDFIKIKKRAKSILNQDNYCESEDRI